MAGNKLNLAVVVSLMKDGFDRGVDSVKRSIDGLKTSMTRWFAVMTGGALALTSLIRSFKQTALETERVRIALKNVTDGVNDLNRAQSFLQRTSRAYGQDLLALSRGYTGFTAAARQANVPMADQERIFEAVSKACATYGLDAQRTGLVTLALSQMMSKGKISAEELRRQMGEHLPVAYMAMAKASGLTTAEFEKMMSSGRILSKDILPKFADALNEITADADFDNYITSWTKLTNEIKLFIGSLNIPQKLKPMIDWLTGAFKTLVGNIRTFMGALAGIKVGSMVRRWVNSVRQSTREARAIADQHALELASINKKIAVAKDRISREEVAIKRVRLREERLLEEGKSAEVTALRAREAKAKAVIDEESLKLKQLQDQRELQSRKATDAAARASTLETTSFMKRAWLSMTTTMKAAWASVKAMLVSSVFGAIAAAIGALLGWITKVIDKAKEATKEAKEVQKILEKTDQQRRQEAIQNVGAKGDVIKSNRAILASDTATEEEKKGARADLRNTYGLTGKTDAELLAQSKTLEEVEVLEKQKEALESDLEKVTAFVSAKGATRIGDSLQSNLMGSRKKEAAGLRDLTYAEYFGGVRDEQKEKRLGNLTNGPAVSNAAYKAKKSLSEYLGGLDNEKQLTEKLAQVSRQIALKKEGLYTAPTVGDGSYGETITAEKERWSREKENLQKQRANSVITDADYEKELSSLASSVAKELSNAGVTKDDSVFAEVLKHVKLRGEQEKTKAVESTLADEVAQVEKKYRDSLKELTNKYEAGAISTDKYNAEVVNISQRHRESMAGLLGAEAKTRDSYIEASATITEHSGALIEAQKGFQDSADVLNRKLADGLISEDEYAKQLTDLVAQTIDRIYTSGEVQEAEREYIAGLRAEAQARRSGAYQSQDEAGKGGLSDEDRKLMATVGKSDNLGGISKGLEQLKGRQKEIGGIIENIIKEAESVGMSKKSLDKLRGTLDSGEVSEEVMRELFQEFSQKLVEELSRAMDSAKTIGDAVKIGETRESTKKEQDRLGKGAYKGLKDVARSSQRVTQSVKAMMDALDNPDASGWEKLVTVFNSLVQAVEAFVTIGKGIKAVIAFLEAMSTATEHAGAVSAAVGATEVATSEAVTAAKVTETGAKTTAAYASLPFIGVALAGAVIGAMIAMIVSSKNRFAQGGIVGGTSYQGDKVLAMVNSGEMILNRSQQARLFEMANGGAVGARAIQSTVVVGGTLTARGDKLNVLLEKQAIKQRRL